MFHRALAIVVCLLGLAGCASTAPSTSASPSPLPAQLPWQDRMFGYDAGRVPVSRDDLFRLDPDVLQELRAATHRNSSSPTRLKQLLAAVFGPDLKHFSYVAGHSTTASETWRNRRGDCLSLTVLTYSAARALDMVVQMQEVEVPASLDRRGQFDVVNRHVNALFPRAHRGLLEDSMGKDVVVDFEPQYATGRAGRPLSEDAILARYYNNVATEHMAQGRKADAYAHFKAAILVEPTFAATYGNLAVLYQDAGLQREAEQLLRRAVALSDSSDVPLRALHRLLVDQGRDAEAKPYAQLLESGRTRDPYHWIELGLRSLQDGDTRKSIDAFEHARSMTSGFDELHRYLAVAYWRAGEKERAQQELSLLASLGDESGVSVLRKKFGKARQ